MMKQLNLAAIQKNDVMKMLKDESKKVVVFEQGILFMIKLFNFTYIKYN